MSQVYSVGNGGVPSRKSATHSTVVPLYSRRVPIDSERIVPLLEVVISGG